MKRFWILAAIVLISCLASTAISKEKGPRVSQDSEAQIRELKRTVAQLEETVTRLEKRIDKLESTRQCITVPSQVLPELRSVPKNWQPRMFNGQPYYIVPLNGD